MTRLRPFQSFRWLGCLALAASCLAQQSPPQYFGRGVWRGQVVDYRVVDGWAIYDGDIIIGRAADLDARYRSALAATNDPAASKSNQSIATADPVRLWPGGVIPYEIDSGFKDTFNFDSAIQHWNSRTAIQFQPRAGEPNYVRFTPFNDPSICASSSLGMNGGVQYVFGTETCPVLALIHEIGHAVGLDHEQARGDREQYIRVLWENMIKPGRSQYSPVANDSDNGPYDYNSIMHYGAGDFSKNGQPTMETLPTGIPIRNTSVLSDGDIDGVNRLYGKIPGAVTISTTPPGLQVTVDGQSMTAPQAISWTAGTSHTLSVPAVQTGDSGRYEFARWSDGGDSTHDVAASQDKTLYTANFVRYNKFNFAVTPDGAGTIAISPDSEDGYYRDGTRIAVTARPNDGYIFVRWAGTFIDQNGLTNYGGNPIGLFASGIHQGLTAVFAPKPPDVPEGGSTNALTRFTSVLASGGSAGAQVRVDGKQYNMPASFLWDPGTVHSIEVIDSFPNAADSSLRVFQQWNDGASRVRQVTSGSTAVTYTATYGIKFGLGYAWNAGGSISVTPRTADSYFDQGSTVVLTATPTAPAQFIGWSQDLWGQDNPFSATMNESIVAYGFFGRPGAVSSLGVADNARARASVVLSGNTFIATVAPGELVDIYVPAFGPDARTVANAGGDGTFPTTLAGVRAYFNGVAAPLIAVAKGQATAVVPDAISGLDILPLQLEYQGVRTTAGLLRVAKAAPAIYTVDNTGKGQARVLNEDGMVNSPDNPASRESVVTLAATGLGIATAAGQPAGKLEVRISGKVAGIVSIGPATGGVRKIAVRVPATALTGTAATLILTVDGAPSQFDTTMAVQ